MKKNTIKVHLGFLKNKTIPFFVKDYSKQKVKTTPAKIKEAVFHIMENFSIDKNSTTFFDVFAGSCQIGIEAISRSYNLVNIIEKNSNICYNLKKWLENNNITEHQIINRNSYNILDFDVLENLLPKSFQNWILYLDPPYIDLFSENSGLANIHNFIDHYNANLCSAFFEKCIIFIQIPSLKSPFFSSLKKSARVNFLDFVSSFDRQYIYGNNQVLLKFFSH